VIARRRPVHPLPVRLAHAVIALALGCMMTSGWAVYDASPLFGWRIPAWATPGGWLGGSLAWHFAAMSMLLANGLLHGLYGLASGHFAPRPKPIRPRALAGDLRLALTLRLPHTPGVYITVRGAPLKTLRERGGADTTANVGGFKCTDRYDTSLDMATARHRRRN
jgi:thiosulfate reductase cytochrome b subunit